MEDRAASITGSITTKNTGKEKLHGTEFKDEIEGSSTEARRTQISATPLGLCDRFQEGVLRIQQSI
ncbi:MAG: hypothetical protein ACLU8D_05795 [Enterocloster sp.]